MNGIPVGTPFRRGGRGPEAYDCWGLVLAELAPLQLPGFVAAGYADVQRLRDAEAASGRWRCCHTPQPGAVVLLGNARRLHHAGVCLPNRAVKHSKRGVGVCIEPLAALRQRYTRMEFWQWA